MRSPTLGHPVRGWCVPCAPVLAAMLQAETFSLPWVGEATVWCHPLAAMMKARGSQIARAVPSSPPGHSTDKGSGRAGARTVPTVCGHRRKKE